MVRYAQIWRGRCGSLIDIGDGINGIRRFVSRVMYKKILWFIVFLPLFPVNPAMFCLWCPLNLVRFLYDSAVKPMTLT